MNETTIKQNVDPFLQEVRTITKRHKEKLREKGEDFNLFSVMGMESNETHTHSAILAALLDPAYNHYAKSLFLEKFLEKIGYEFKGRDLNNTRVIKEYHIGSIDADYERGGFIDILIIFDSGHTLAIENKIYAKDQRKQLYRYSKHNESKTQLCYLTLYGTDPSEYSYQSLELKNIRKISYKEDIIEWLSVCQQHLQPDSILSISIKKYILLLKKLTNTMDKTHEMEFTKSILNNYEAAQYVHSNFDKLIYNVRESFRQAVIGNLRNKLIDSNYRVVSGNAADFHFSQIWIELDNSKDLTMRFGIESFSGKGNENGRIFIGIFDRLTQEINIDFADESIDKYLSKYWPVIRLIKTPKNNPLHLNSGDLLLKLNDENSQTFKDLLEETVSQVIKFVNEYTEVIREIDINRGNRVGDYTINDINES
ncbi:PDDEXK-like family protein [Aequorivita viscosa]|uniref:PD-(D/E)XK nuclease superfamily protein n=1 Tax=Aequorivita viscosa TaxID=797419 RepID=A0A1M6M469_9FLAO|nr:PD-(D/E)XK nuclease family protein [Aequorivita viscosa]SDX30673.1 PD-(D/E)XK nuclease superfamily protein [Aequorivita viscosa]SHJ78221.1 PD-(D/E)XK nuclease superfamily protein [Aequorivita viscosa]